MDHKYIITLLPSFNQSGNASLETKKTRIVDIYVPEVSIIGFNPSPKSQGSFMDTFVQTVKIVSR